MKRGKRDPRRDPRPGDVLRVDGPLYAHVYFEVLEHDPRYGTTDISFFDPCEGRERVWSINQWRERMAKAEVLVVEA